MCNAQCVHVWRWSCISGFYCLLGAGVFFFIFFKRLLCIVVTTYRSFGVVFKATWQILHVAHCGAHTRKQKLTLTFSRKNGINHIWDVFWNHVLYDHSNDTLQNTLSQCRQKKEGAYSLQKTGNPQMTMRREGNRLNNGKSAQHWGARTHTHAYSHT